MLFCAGVGSVGLLTVKESTQNEDKWGEEEARMCKINMSHCNYFFTVTCDLLSHT